MKRLSLLFICLIALVCFGNSIPITQQAAFFSAKPAIPGGGGGGGGIAKIFSTGAAGTSGGCTTAPATNTTSSTLFVGATGGYRTTTPLQSDSKVNSWTGLTEQAPGGGIAARLWYVGSPTTDSAQTFSADGGNVGSTAFSSEATVGFSGCTTIDGESAGAFGAGTTAQPGSRTPSQGGTVFVTVIRSDANNTWTIDSGFTILYTGVNESSESFALAYKIKASGDSTAENPTWTLATGATPDFAVVMSNFK